METNELPEDYKLIPMSEIDDDARKIAVLWVEGLAGEPSAIWNKAKLASDIMNYAKHRLKSRDEQLGSVESLVTTLEEQLKAKDEEIARLKSLLETYVREDLIYPEPPKQ